MNSWQTIQSFDLAALIWVQQNLRSSVMDQLMILISARTFWLALAGAYLIWMVKKRQQSNLIRFFQCALTLGLVDITTAQILKPYFGRPRPCKAWPDLVQIIDGCAGQLSFPSNHAANGAVLMVFAFLISPKVGKVALGLLVGVGFSRVYLGVHYPSDIVIGILYGGTLAVLAQALIKRTKPPISREP